MTASPRLAKAISDSDSGSKGVRSKPIAVAITSGIATNELAQILKPC